MILGGFETASPLHRFALAVTKWVGLEVANQGTSPTYPLRAGALALAKRLENRSVEPFMKAKPTAAQNSEKNRGRVENLKSFKPGQSGNPGRRPKKRPITKRYRFGDSQHLRECIAGAHDRLAGRFPKGEQMRAWAAGVAG